MASETTKKANAATEQSRAPVKKDDGTRWIVITDSDAPVYITYGGTTREEAERLRDGLLAPASIIQVNIKPS